MKILKKSLANEVCQMMIKASPSGMILVDQEGIIIYINPKCEELFEYDYNELIGKKIEILLPEKNKSNHVKVRDTFFLHPETRHMGKGRDLYGQKKMGDLFPIEIGLNYIQIKDKKLAFATIIDISERKQKEALEKEKDQAIKTNRLKDEFLANMSHEIRTPMNAILGFTDLLSHKIKGTEEIEYVDYIKIAGENLLNIINDILDLAKIESGMMTFETHPLDILGLLKSIDVLFKPKASKKNISLSFICAENIPAEVYGDPTRLTQIIMNLVANSIKFTNNGEITVHAKVLNRDTAHIVIEFTVSDTGIGMEKDKLEFIFDRFRQAEEYTTRKYGGSGLGLSIVKNLVEMQGGTISVKSVVNRGSQFVFFLPFALYEKKPSITQASNMKIIEQKGNIGHLKILLAEDNELNVKLTMAIFKKYNVIPDVAANGKIAIQKLKDAHYDILLLDMQMPEMNGYQTASYVRGEMRNNIPIIALTAHAMAGEKERCIQMGMNDYISKPFVPDVLIEKIIALTKANAVVAEKSIATDKLFDPNYLIETIGNDPELIREFQDLFIQQYSESIQLLLDAIDNNKFISILEICHKLKSSASSMGIVKLFNLLEEMEQIIIEEKDTAKISLFYGEIKNLFERLCQEIPPRDLH